MLGAYLFPAQSWASASSSCSASTAKRPTNCCSGDVKQKTTEVDLNYVIKQHNARVTAFYIGQDYDNSTPDSSQIGVALQVQL